MKKRLTIALIFLVCFCNAQNFKFGKVSKEELQKKAHVKDTSANATVLYKSEDIYFVYTQTDGFVQHRIIHERIKIYNKEGFDWATKKVYLYKGGTSGSKEKISDLKANTYNLVGGKVEKEKLKKDGIFKENFNEFTDINTITMPNIKEGCVIEYSYKITSPFLAIDDIIFQYNIPIDKFDLKVRTPEYYMYNHSVNPRAFYYPNITKSIINNKATYTSKTQSRSDDLTTGGNDYSRKAFNYQENILESHETDIPALKVEAYAGSVNNYRALLTMELSAILNSYGAIEKSFSNNWDQVSRSIMADSDFGNQLSRSVFFKKDIADITSEEDNDFQKALRLQNYVKRKVKWNGINGFMTMKGTKKAYEQGEGNVADINLLLIAMLRSKEVNANPVLVSTRNNGIPIYPTRKGFNYVICMVENEDSYVLLDATENYSTVNILPQRTLNWQGRVLRDNGNSSWISLRPNAKSSETTSLNIKILDDFSVEGKVRQSITEHRALNYRKNYAKLSNEAHIKRLEKNKGDVEIINLDFKNDDNISKPVMITYDYEASDVIDDIGGNLYFSPLLFYTLEENPFKLEKREYPIDFTYPIKTKYLVNIMLPEGYVVESLPKSAIMDFKNGGSKFEYVARENGNFLQFNIEFDISSSLIQPEDYESFKNFFNGVVEKQTEQIVLKKL
ncbi:transglutaminase domain-containing protein [uncultured Winogradskyella sp.]|uniref:transglutaminase domain-containing protein n=1 Tax=uncultured Winogradskyella sp. TaxID=395353 RepID=UPI0026341F7D|nr:transglutaminase domain-containing protein [uncultured Winogradskyella sp.]